MSKSRIHIAYFSGTGNSWRLSEVAKNLFEAWNFEVTSAAIPSAKVLEEGNLPLSEIHKPLIEADLILFIAPVYALDLPRLMKHFIEKLPPARLGQRAAVLINGGAWDEAGWAVDTAVSRLKAKQYDVRLGEVVMMPNNWIPMMDAPRPDEAEKIRVKAFEWLEATLDRMLHGDVLIIPVNTKVYGKMGSPVVRGLFHKSGVKFLYKRFKTTKTCTACGVCVKNCPADAITMDDNKNRPKWNSACEQCVRCMNLCPTRSIIQLEAIGHGSKRMAYMDPEFKKQLFKPKNSEALTPEECV